MNMVQKIVTRAVIPALLLLIGAGCVGIMAVLAPTAKQSDAEETPVAVNVVVAESATHRAVLTLTGQVEAERQVALAVEVAGRVSSMADGLRPGRMFRKGERILQIDARDYEAALAAENARLKSAELELAVEENRQKTAARELELVGGTAGGELALRKPHLERAQANLEANRKARERAALNVERTRLRAPFNGVVVTESVEVGQLIGAGSPVVQMVGTDAVRVTASLPVAQLGQVVLPKPGEDTGSAVMVAQKLADGGEIARAGTVTGLSGALDPATRTASLMMTIPDPYSEEGPPLLPGAFVSVTVEGVEFSDVYALPHNAVIENRMVWLDVDGELKRRGVVVGWRTKDSSYITDGLQSGDRVVTTTLSLPIEGMKVLGNE